MAHHLVVQRLVGEHDLQRAGRDRARRHRVHAHLGRAVGRKEAGHVRQRGLGGAVGDEPAVAEAAHRRGDVDHRPVAPGRAGGGARLGERERGGHVEVERFLERPHAGVEERHRHRAPDVVHDDVEPAELARPRCRPDPRPRRRRTGRRPPRPRCVPSLRTCAATSSSCDTVRAAITTSAPDSANASAEAAPMPRPAAVTMATRSSRRKRSISMRARYRGGTLRA